VITSRYLPAYEIDKNNAEYRRHYPKHNKPGDVSKITKHDIRALTN
jgi:hypothetical protein